MVACCRMEDSATTTTQSELEDAFLSGVGMVITFITNTDPEWSLLKRLSDSILSVAGIGIVGIALLWTVVALVFDGHWHVQDMIRSWSFH